MRNYRFIKGLTLSCLLLVSFVTNAQSWVALDGAKEGVGYTMEVLNSDAVRHQARVKVHGYYDHIMKVDNEEYHQISLPDASETHEAGSPQLPVIPLLIAIPEGATYKVSVEEGCWKDVPIGKIYPAQPDVKESTPDPEFQISEEAYKSIPHKVSLISTSSEQVWRNIRNVGVYLLPFRYNPIENRLSVLTDFVLTVKFEGASSQSKVKKKDIADAVQWHMFNNHIESFPVDDESIRSASSSDDYDYLIIVGNLPEIINSQTLQDFRKWKAFKGYKTKVVSTTTIGTTPEAIKSYISQEYYTNNINYVLFIGDSNEIPFKSIDFTSYDPSISYLFDSEDIAISDYWYGCLDNGYDYCADVPIGRFSTTILSDFQNMVNKSIAYESSYSGNYKKTLLVSHKEDGPGKYEGCCEEIKSTYNSALSFYTAHGRLGVLNTDVVGYINAGIHIVNYRGHGEETLWGIKSGITPKPWNTFNEYFEAPEISNINSCSIYFNVCCKTGNISAEPCMMETFIRSSKGAIACLAYSRDTYTSPNNIYDKELFSTLLVNNVYDVGLLNTQSHTNTIYSPSERGKYNAYCSICGGDPTLEIWTGTPQSYDDVVLSKNGSSITISSPSFSSNDKVSIVSSSGELIQKSTMSGTSCTFTPPTSNFYVAVSRHNYYPYTVYCSLDNYMQNETIETDSYYYASPLNIGYDVTTAKPNGNVTVKSGTKLTIQNGSGGVTIKNGFECENGSELIIE
ncbi:MAG: hypothetical protein K6D55_05500 [Prevotella sp.]|nr:hypothetical protein [Prevotella sp.]